MLLFCLIGYFFYRLGWTAKRRIFKNAAVVLVAGQIFIQKQQLQSSEMKILQKL